MKAYKLLIIIFIGMSISLCHNAQRLVTVGGCVTESVFRLGAGDYVVAVDQSSTSPSSVKELPQVGYIRAISSEGILSMSPSLILTTTDIGPPKVIEQINDSGVEMLIFDSPHSINDIFSLVNNVSSALHLDNKGTKLVEELKIIDIEVQKSIKKYSYSPKIVFFMNPSSGSYNAAGSETRADYLIQYIGGTNVFNNKFNRYSKVTKEEILNSDPDIILAGSIMPGNNDKLSSLFLDNTEFKSLKAVKNNKVIVVDLAKYLTFGPNFLINAQELITNLNIEQE